jgi:hypothetical protein
MRGTSLVVPDDGRGRDVPRGRFRRRIRGYVVAGVALGGWFGFLLLVAILLLGRLGGPSAIKGANTAIAPSLLVSPLIVAEPWVATAMPILVGPTTPRGGWIRISGVPALASLSSGHTIGRGVWKVPFAGLSTLTVMAPARDSIRSDLSIALMSSEGSPVAEAHSTLALIPPALCGAVPTIRTGSLPDDIPPGPAKVPARLLSLPVLTNDDDRRRAQELVLLGEIQRLQGRLGSARGYYEQAANMGWPRGAMALAATFDPHEITATTVRPDIEAARAWYRQSRELMDAAIEFYLKWLAQ